MIRAKRVKNAKKPYWEMNSDELREATRRFDDSAYQPRSLPLTAADRAQHTRARRRGRPKVGQGAQRIQLTMERSLLGRVDAEAKAQGLTRAQFLARAAQRALAKAS